MELTVEQLTKLGLVAAAGLDIDYSGVPVTAESVAIFEKLGEEVEASPDGVMMDLPHEWSNSYSALIDASREAHGSPFAPSKTSTTAPAAPANSPIVPNNDEPPVAI
jgi:hypothetical protein